MNFYRRFPGDYARDTADLTLEQHGAYNVTLDIHYATEKPLPSNNRVLYRMTRAESRSERAAVDFVMERYFTKTPKGYTQKRVLEEIEYAQSRADAARQNGKLGGRPRKSGNPVAFSEKPNGNPAGLLDETQRDSKQQEPSGIANGKLNETQKKAIPDFRLQTPEVRGTCAEKRARIRARPAMPDDDPMFAKFWSDYPKPIQLRRTVANWRTLSESEQVKAVEALAAFRSCDDWKEQNGKFIPSPHRFLEDRRWEHIPPAGERQKGEHHASSGSRKAVNGVNSGRGTNFAARATVLPEL